MPLGRVTSGPVEGTRWLQEVVNECTSRSVLQTFGRNSEI